MEDLIQAVNEARLDKYLRKPYEKAELLGEVGNLLSTFVLERELVKASINIVGQDRQIGKLLKTIHKISSADSSIFITGENGTVKWLWV